MTLDPIRKPKPVLGRTARLPGVGFGGFWEALEVRQLLSAAVSTATPAISLEYMVPAKKGAAVSVQGYTPAEIKSAYGFTGLSETGSGQTIAIVDAYNDPNITSDLGTFDSEFGLAAPPSFQIVSQTGSTTKLPATDAGWAQEISLDVEWAHAIAPDAKILLVEASSDSTTNLVKAVNYARSASGVSVVSMSWGGSEFAGETSDDQYFTTPSGHTGVTFVAAAGDEGAAGGAEWPACSPNVVAVGGTTLTLSGSTYTSESAWSDTSDGTSEYEATPSYQSSLGVTGRTTSDVSYDADPNTGFPTYDSLSYEGEVGWAETGGTSAGTPQWAGLIALADQGRVTAGKATLDGATGTLPALYGIYSNSTEYASDFNDITTGSNGSSGFGGGGGGGGGGGYGGGGYGGGGFGGGGYGGGGYGGGYGGGFGGHHRGDFVRSSDFVAFEEAESSAATTSDVSLTSATTGYDGPTGLGTPKAAGLVDSLIAYGSVTDSVVKKAQATESLSPDVVHFRPAVAQTLPPPAPITPAYAAEAVTSTSSALEATSLNRPEPLVELDTAVGLARPSTSTAATADSVDPRSQAGIGFMSGFLTETQVDVILAKVASALKPIAQSTAAVAQAVAAEARQATGIVGGEIAASTAPYLLAQQPILAMANIDASATVGDAMTSLTDELATIPRRVNASHSNARAWVITGFVIAADAILLARYKLKRAVFNDKIKIAL